MLPTVSNRLLATLKRRIVRGDLRPGDRLPDRRALVRTFGVSPVTVQSAITRLVEEGFATVGARKHGTFVAAKPPHLHHYKILFPHDPAHRGEFWRVLRDQAAVIAGETDRDFSFFYGLGGHRDIASYNELVEDVRAERVAGLIFASGATEFRGTPILDQPGIPRVAIAAEYELPGIPKMLVNHASFFEKALDALAASNRRRIAVLFGASAGDSKSQVEASCRAAMAARGLAVNPLWMQFVGVWSPESARRCVRLLLHGRPADRPDGLILADDNFVPSATRGILESGVRVPGALTVVALANFPAGVEAAVPVIRVGFDVKAMLERMSDWIDLLRAGKRLPAFRKALAMEEEEDYNRSESGGAAPRKGAGPWTR